jgi:hypothetical protein
MSLRCEGGRNRSFSLEDSRKREEVVIGLSDVADG